MSDEIRINGNLVSWSSTVLKIDGERWYGVTSISFSHKRERAYGYGAARSHGPLGRSAGKYTPDPLKITMWKHTAIALRQALGALAPDSVSYGNVEVPIFLQWVEGDTTTNVKFERACVTSENVATEEGPDPLKEEWEFSVMSIEIDGLSLADKSEA